MRALTERTDTMGKLESAEGRATEGRVYKKRGGN